MEKLIKKINEMLENVINTNLNINDNINQIIEGKSRFLGSGNQCYKIMYMVTQYFDVQKVLEIGTHQGFSAIVFCQAIFDNNKIPEIHTVDNWSQSQLEENAKTNIRDANFTEYITMHNGDSLIKVPEVLTKIGKVDLIFIDGNHNIDYVIKDYNNCKKYSNQILFHDTQRGEKPYLRLAEDDGYTIYNFQTKYVEGDGHLIGISLAIKE